MFFERIIYSCSIVSYYIVIKHNTHKSEKKNLYRNSKQNADSEDLSNKQTSEATELDILRYIFWDIFIYTVQNNGVYMQLDAKCNINQFIIIEIIFTGHKMPSSRNRLLFYQSL